MPKRKAGQIPVTVRALVQRINRKLKANNQILKARRGGSTTIRFRNGCGDHYLLDFAENRVLAFRLDPEVVGRELGVLKPFESVVPGEVQ